MKTLVLPLVLCAIAGAQTYTPGPDSQPQAGVPEGKVTKYTWTSKIYPGTVRDYWVYVPSQYDGQKPAAVMIFQDGGGMVGEKSAWRAPVVLDNLIHKREMPVTIAIFINPGVLPAQSESSQARYNRSYEYDALGDRYARFLLEEILPEVGKQYKLSNDPNDRGLMGSSSGAIAAFTAAWERPDQFRRVLSFIGSYTNLRGGHVYSSLVRKTEPKPLRVYLQDGSNDQNIYSGNWWIGNQDLASALAFAGYDTTFVTGTEGHNSRHGSAILPDALRWLWRDPGTPIAAASGRISERHEVRLLIENERGWEKATTGVPAELKGNGSVAITSTGNRYSLEPAAKRVSFVDATGKKRVAHEGIADAGGIALSADQSLVFVNEQGGKWVWSFQAQPDGSLAHGQAFYRLETPDESSASGAAGMTVDVDGYLYVATALGVQVCDQAGRVVAILNPPSRARVTNIAFGGPDRQTLYALAGGDVYARPLKRKGVAPGSRVKPPQPRL